MRVFERHIPSILIAALLPLGCGLLYGATVQAEETIEPRAINTTAKPPKGDGDDLPLKPAPRARKVYPILPSDPVFVIESQWRDAEAAGAFSAVTVPAVRGETPAGKLPDWHFPLEEMGPPPRTGAPLPGPGADPETARFAVNTEDGSAAAGAAGHADAPKKSPNAGTARLNPLDPEVARFADGPEAPHTAAPESKPLLIQRSPARMLEDAPRIESGSSLDMDDPKPALLAAAFSVENAAEKPAEDAKPTAILPAVHDETKSAEGSNTPAAQHKWAAKDMLADPRKTAPAAAQPQGPGPGPGKTAGGKSENPEERTQQLLKEIVEKQKNLDTLTRKAIERMKPVVNPQNGLPIRGEHEKKIVNTLLDKQRPLGAVSVKVFDPKTKLLLPSRVSLIDTTEATARAPLASGFACRGSTPGINVVSGLVRAEIHSGGRFCPTFIKGLDVLAGKVLPLEVPMSRPPQLNFEARGWVLADLDIGLRKQPGEAALWFGPPPGINDLILSAQAEGVRVVGISLPLGDETAMNQVRAALEKPMRDVCLIPVFPGQRNLFNGSGAGLGVTNWDGLKTSSALPEVPLREAFEGIRARGGLAVMKDLKGSQTCSIEDAILPLYRRLKATRYFEGAEGNRAHPYSASEFPFDTVTGSYDVLAFDGTDAMQDVWFNLLDEGVPVRVIGAGGGSLEGGRIPFGQTFLQTEGPPTSANVLRAIESGRTVISFGPAVFCKIFERDMGPGAVLPTDGRQLQLQVEAYSTLTPGAQLQSVEIIRNGKVVYTQSAAEGESEIIDMRFPISETANAWYLVRVTERIGHGKGANGEQFRRAWTSPIFFRNAVFTPPAPAVSHVHGILRKGLTPVRGVVTALAAGMPTQRVESGPDGAFSITLPSTGTLIFECPDCEPSAKRIFEHPRVQNGVGRLLASGDLMQKLADRPIFGLWRLLLSDLEWDITLFPSAEPPEPPRLPEPQ